MWRESTSKKKSVFKSLANQDRCKYMNDYEKYLEKKKYGLPQKIVNDQFLTPAMKKQKFDFNYPSDVITPPKIPSFWECGVNYIPENDFVVEELGFNTLLHEKIEQMIKYNVKSYESKNEELEIPNEPPKNLFDWQECDSDEKQNSKTKFFDVMPTLDKYTDDDSIDSMKTVYIEVEMPELKKQM